VGVLESQGETEGEVAVAPGGTRSSASNFQSLNALLLTLQDLL